MLARRRVEVAGRKQLSRLDINTLFKRRVTMFYSMMGREQQKRMEAGPRQHTHTLMHIYQERREKKNTRIRITREWHKNVWLRNVCMMWRTELLENSASWRTAMTRRSTRPPDNLSGEESSIFDLTILKERSSIVITKSKILARSDRSSLRYEPYHDNSLWKIVIFRCFRCKEKAID